MGKSTALHQGSSKYLTAQDTHITLTQTKHDKTVTRFVKLLSLQPRSIIQINILRCIRPSQSQSGRNFFLKTSLCADRSQHFHETNRINSCYTKSLRIFFGRFFFYIYIFCGFLEFFHV